MRLHIKKCLWITMTIVTVQLALMYWGINKPMSLMKTRSSVKLKRNSKAQDIPKTGTCNSQLCNPVKDDMLNVHIIAHSHDDVGWLKTLDQYYTGQTPVGDAYSYHNGPECVRCVLNTTIPELMENPNRRFIFIEMAFFSMWWKEISKTTQDVVRELIKQRRLEFAIGGWCMSDAATTYYNDIIDQHTLGFDFINKHFGPCAQSNVAWHVDQFGHSREHSSIFAQMGFDAIVLGRIDNQDLANREQSKTLELLWEGSPDNLGNKASLFTHISGGYYSPAGYVMEGWDEQRMKTMEIDSFLREISKKHRLYRSNHVMIPMGSDFGYRQAGEWFHNLDILIDRINSQRDHVGFDRQINVLYSTPSCFFYHLNKAQVTFPTKTEDFFPYAVDNGYWTGYFTSKGGLKLHVKRAGALLQACKQLGVFAGLANSFNKTHVLKAAMGVLQHHDAITGTEKEHVVKDYNKMLSHGVTNCQEVVEEAYQYLIGDSPNTKLHQEFCPDLNISSCVTTESSHKFGMLVYNPLSRPVVSWIRLPVTHGSYTVSGPKGEVPWQVVPIPQSTFSIPDRAKSLAKHELVFEAKLPAMGVSSFVIEGLPGPINNKMEPVPNLKSISSKNLIVHFDQSGFISRIQNLKLNIELNVKQEYGFYKPRMSNRPSGAYIFAPRESKVTPAATGPIQNTIYRGSECTEVHQIFSERISQVIRLYKDADYLELEWTVGGLNNERFGMEVVSLFTTDLKTKGEFYTDSNGREMLKRVRDHRETWKLDVTETNRLSGNYYPVTSKIFIEDSARDLQLTVLSDRCQGGSSELDGQLELMLHRKTLYDDGLGVGEPLNEMGIDGKGLILRGKHIVYVGTVEASVQFHREKALEIHLAPTLSFINSEQLTGSQEMLKQTTAFSALKTALPLNIQILSLDYVKENTTDSLLIRLEHIYEKAEHPTLSEPATVNLQSLFGALYITGIEELSLGGNFNISQVNRLRWKTEHDLSPSKIGPTVPLTEESPLLVTLYPMEIRTFHIDVQEEETNKSFFKYIFR